MESVIEFKLPALGENIEQGDLVRLMISPGTTVAEGQAVMELETDKAVVEVPSSVSGTVKEVLVKEGEKIKVGQVIFTADNNGTAPAVTETQRQESSVKQSAAKPEPEQATPAAAVESQSQAPAQTQSQAPPPRTRSTDAGAGEFRLQELG